MSCFNIRDQVGYALRSSSVRPYPLNLYLYYRVGFYVLIMYIHYIVGTQDFLDICLNCVVKLIVMIYFLSL